MKKKKFLSNGELSVFCEQMSMILKSGLTPAAGIELLLEDADNSGAREILKIILEKCNEGESFHDAIKAPGVFPLYAVNMIHIGNIAGTLDETFDALAYHYSREENIYESIKSAVTYPFLMICMMLVVIAVLIVKVLPIFRQVFQMLGTDLNSISLGLLSLGDTIRNYSYIFILLLFVGIVLFFYITRSGRGRRKAYTFLSRFFVTSGFFAKLSAARFASGMATTLRAGLDTTESMELVYPLIQDGKIKDKIKQCQKLVEGDGESIPMSFTNAVVETGIFSNLNAKLLSIGTATGSPEKVLKKIAENYDNEIDKELNRIISILEPSLVIILSIIVSLILLSVMLPLIGIMASM